MKLRATWGNYRADKKARFRVSLDKSRSFSSFIRVFLISHHRRLGIFPNRHIRCSRTNNFLTPPCCQFTEKMIATNTKIKTGKGSRKASTLPAETVEYLKNWMMSPEHIAHPYPTEQEKAQIMEDTGIELKQLTNWFVNNRKRYWKPRVEAHLQHQAQGPSTSVRRAVVPGSTTMGAVSPEASIISSMVPPTGGLVHFDLPRTSSQASIVGTDISKALMRKDSVHSLNLISEASSNASDSASETEESSVQVSSTEDYSTEYFVKSETESAANSLLQASGQRSSQSSPSSSPSKKHMIMSRTSEGPHEMTPRKKFRRSSLETWRYACQEASNVYCESLPTLEEASRLFGYTN